LQNEQKHGKSQVVINKPPVDILMMKTRGKTKPTGQPRENSEMKRFLDGMAGWGVDLAKREKNP
jgi:hypothetical protein